MQNKYGQTPLHVASELGNMDLVQLLLDSGANVTVTNANGQTPLHLACAKGHTDVVKGHSSSR
jgi:ankyrin repeat protein